jgi:hypothetical protein
MCCPEYPHRLRFPSEADACRDTAWTGSRSSGVTFSKIFIDSACLHCHSRNGASLIGEGISCRATEAGVGRVGTMACDATGAGAPAQMAPHVPARHARFAPTKSSAVEKGSPGCT